MPTALWPLILVNVTSLDGLFTSHICSIDNLEQTDSGTHDASGNAGQFGKNTKQC